MEKLHSDIESVRILVSLLIQKGIRDVVLSPGSRNAPLLVSISRARRLHHRVIVDERSAAFFALGMAQQSGEPVALVCTSGTALLNYAPAVAEAYYQGVPLIVISADRPTEWIDQDDSQTIHQQNALAPFVKASYQLPTVVTNEEDHWHANRLVNEAINLSRTPRKGPVHVNIPLREPLYEFHHKALQTEREIDPTPAGNVIPGEVLNQLRQEYSSATNVMIIAGFQAPDPALQQRIEQLAGFSNTVVFTESISNLTTPCSFSTIDRIISTVRPVESKAYAPDLLITFGGAIVSRMIKAFIRNHPPRVHWHIDERTSPPDTYKSMTRHVQMSAGEFFKQFLTTPFPLVSASGYAWKWLQKAETAASKHEAYVNRIPWCDLKAFSILMPAIPADSRLQLGNSTPIRYAQLFRYSQVSRSDANRGTSGIDGCTSTAIGAACAFNGMTTLIVGDNSFLYDSNALWMKGIPPRLRIIVMQNGGGGIFRFLPGPSALQEVEKFFQTPHKVDLKQLASVYNFDVYKVSDEMSLQQALVQFFLPSQRPAILIIETPGDTSGEILKGYFEALK
ncbi:MULTISPECIES: 2-succinyl-5-enolpyruvyl-6-hydroxy-3-cyclohexene-1-carboxylic-acid synthase [Butyricimonas]|uniref:2-succinyl-5-enolpyruvyl-6-hydroxy-3- cyclohexene-1-carboxylic-acid synthase n=1 Tax=Butyricimonas TaxID=574697 RepID=UPI0007FB40A1|nr:MULTISPECIES: 2-succinyl-5-enolpyruvyl-6-hydroxy-3-cyclohexene-1-carboxylic-acid synthase [Butyricimonas]